MKKVLTLVLLLGSVALAAQETVSLEQKPGTFTQKELKLKAGSYVFEVTNNGVDKEVGFVLAPKGSTEQKSHIKEAYLTKTVSDGESSKSKVVKLAKGEYVYFCPLNPTPQYTLKVE